MIPSAVEQRYSSYFNGEQGSVKTLERETGLEPATLCLGNTVRV
jgi:hypothetical protein